MLAFMECTRGPKNLSAVWSTKVTALTKLSKQCAHTHKSFALRVYLGADSTNVCIIFYRSTKFQNFEVFEISRAHLFDGCDVRK